jgi:hypothetical protein
MPNEQITQIRIIKRRKASKVGSLQKASLAYTSQNKYLGWGENGNINVISIKNNAISGSSISNKNVDLELYSYYFKTSKYNTLAEKLNSSDYSATATRDGFGNLEGYSANFGFAEGFDVFDVTETRFNAFGEKFVIYPLIHISEQKPGNSWVQNYVTNYFYSNWRTAFWGSGYRNDIAPAYIRKSATSMQSFLFEPSLEPVGILPMSGEPPLSAQEINAVTSKYYNLSVTSMAKHFNF